MDPNTYKGQGQQEITVKCNSTGQEKKINVSFSQSSEYDPNYESDDIKFIKSTNLIKQDEITFNDGYIFWGEGSVAVDTPFHRDFVYECMYINKRDELVNENLTNESVIDFDKGISYQNFLNNSYKLEAEDQIVLNSSYINIWFNYPNHAEKVTFTIKADDKIIGFSKKELARKIMQRYHLLYYLTKHYDIDRGVFSENNGTGMFRSIMDWEYTKNGVGRIAYRKDLKVWEIFCIDEI